MQFLLSSSPFQIPVLSMDFSFFSTEMEAADQFFDYKYNDNKFICSSNNSFYELDDLTFYSDTYTTPPLSHFSPEIFTLQEFNPPVGPMNCQYQYHPGSFVPNSSNVKKQKLGGNMVLSAQSIAARERRRKISDKTGELGKLIPGGSKMNTAQMFQAAFNYVRFLQAQVGVLQLMESFYKERKEVIATQELETLLSSPRMQEKLYSEEKCLVPKKFVQTIAKDQYSQAESLIMEEEIDQFLLTNT